MLTIQTGGLGVMTLASLLGLLVSKHLGLTTKILTASDLKSSKYGELGALIRVVFITAFGVEAVVCLLLIPRFMDLRETFGDALWHSVFFAVSAFNNAGFDISTDGFAVFGSSWSVAIPMILGITMGAIGFPVIRNMLDFVRMRKWRVVTLNTKLVLTVYLTMDIFLLVWFFTVEWHNAALFSADILADTSKHITSLTFGSFTTRASGFGILNTASLSDSTLLLAQIWMFVGGAPASTAAGIKVTTVAVFFLAIRAEFKGRTDITAFGKRLPSNALRVASTVLISGVVVVVIFIILLEQITDAPMNVVVFDVISAYANCGLTLGLPNIVGNVGLTVLGVLMYIGRLGTMTIAASLMKRDRTTTIRYPSENIILG
jgi:Trk-type K+ transport system membrane component